MFVPSKNHPTATQHQPSQTKYRLLSEFQIFVLSNYLVVEIPDWHGSSVPPAISQHGIIMRAWASACYQSHGEFGIDVEINNEHFDYFQINHRYFEAL